MQEVLRIMLNCSRDLPWSKVVTFLNDAMARMQFSGYSKRFRYQVLCSAFNAYQKLIELDTVVTRPLYRPRTWNRQQWIIAKKYKNLIGIKLVALR
jgi:hypothetical protein